MAPENDTFEDSNSYLLTESRDTPETLVYDAETAALRALNEQAKNNYGSLIIVLDARYAHNVQELEKNLTERKRNAQTDASPLTSIHPDLLVVGSYLGFKPHETIQKIMEGRSLPVQSVAEVVDPNHANQPIDNTKPHYNRYSAVSMDGSNLPYVMQASEYNTSRMVASFHYGLRKRYADKHEQYHYLDDEFVSPTGKSLSRPDSRLLLEDPAYRLHAMRTQWGEGFADIGAVGDLIRDGESLDVIDTVLEQRGVSADLGHYTSPMLIHFRESIEDMGIEAFRSLDQEQAVELYKTTVRLSGITEEEIKLAAYHDLAMRGHPSDIEKLNTIVQSGEYLPHKILDAQPYARLLNKGYKTSDTDDTPRSTQPKPSDEKDIALEKRLLLIDRAFEDSGVLTPETLSKSFITVINELRESDNPQAVQEITQIKKAYETSYDIPFVAENHVRGVDIFKSNVMSIEKPNFDATYLRPLQNRRPANTATR